MNEIAFAFDLKDRAVRKVICNIREDEDNDKIIISSYKGYKILDNEEEFKYLLSKKVEIMQALRRYYKDVERFNANGKYQLGFSSEEKVEVMKTIGV